VNWKNHEDALFKSKATKAKEVEAEESKYELGCNHEQVQRLGQG
jgi:hypothetical protein